MLPRIFLSRKYSNDLLASMSLGRSESDSSNNDCETSSLIRSQRTIRQARKVGLTYVNDFDRGITRRRCGRGFVYMSPRGRILKSLRSLKRFKSLVIPPAWEDVWICPRINGHIQARGRDEAGRTQYIYHEHWQAISSATKFDRMHLVAEVLPRIRRRVVRDLKGRKLSKRRVLAAIVRLMDKSYVRVGNEHYTELNGSRGATTLTTDHVEVRKFTVTLDFPGKSGQQQEIEFTDEQTSKVIRQCEEIDEQFLFCYRDEDGQFCRVQSTDVNEYLREISGESITSKDFRTWWGSVLALDELADISAEMTKGDRKNAIADAVCVAADALGNTKAVCRKSYIHPGLLAAADSGELPQLVSRARRSKKALAGLTVPETLLAKLLPHLEQR